MAPGGQKPSSCGGSGGPTGPLRGTGSVTLLGVQGAKFSGQNGFEVFTLAEIAPPQSDSNNHKSHFLKGDKYYD